VVAVELPTTLLDVTSPRMDIWQGNCTFGDGAAAVWVSSTLNHDAMALEDLHYSHQADTGLDLIRWDYRRYYTFALADEKTFNNDVRQFVMNALSATEAGWKNEPRWAIHPAGISLLVRIGRKVGIPQEALQPSLAHYRKYSNMSSASLLFILKGLAANTPAGSAINLLTMGAGFNVIYGRVRKER
jgi:predicted naringenin-chalcone synthase